MFFFTILCMTFAVSTAQADVLVGTDGPPPSGAVRRFDNNGVFLGNFTSGGPNLDGPAAVHFGPDGNLYVLTSSNRVFRYNGSTGVFIDEFIPLGILDDATDMIFGPDGDLYIANNEGNNPIGEGGEVLRFDGATGAIIGTFILNGAGQGPPTNSDTVCEAMSMAFDPNGKFFYLGNDPRQCNGGTDAYNVMRFNAGTGIYIDTPFPAGFLGLYDPNGMTIGPDCNLYISSEGLAFGGNAANPNVIYRLNLSSGDNIPDTIEEFVPSNGLLDNNGPFPPGTGLIEPEKIVFGPDGNLYVTSGDTAEVYRYDSITGALIGGGAFIAQGLGQGSSDPKGITFFPGESLQCVLPITTIPTLNEWGLIAMAGVLGIIAIFAIRRKKAVV